MLHVHLRSAALTWANTGSKRRPCSPVFSKMPSSPQNSSIVSIMFTCSHAARWDESMDTTFFQDYTAHPGAPGDQSRMLDCRIGSHACSANMQGNPQIHHLMNQGLPGNLEAGT